RRLLDVQALDTKIDQATHRRGHVEAAVRLARLTEQREAALEAAAAADAELSDIRRELTRAEDDVEKVKARRIRDQGRLDQGSGGAKELVALQHEVEALDRRMSDLEDAELEVMERVDSAAEVAGLARAVTERVDRELEAVGVEVAAAYAEIDGEVAGVRSERERAAAGLDGPLVALYERLRASRGGVGAAQLRGKRCEGCRLELTPADLEHIRAASPDEVIRCEECGRILVRMEDSGL
ncbi:MAG: C4-type zinc ribbon domain-containing protein, partial [Bifidobacteriaceae bacterium]|nr:C4-type zinc ribbon domain-containing protein [Bifidobacteriaceae bacterium]